ncbi:hypothetical protein ACG873_30325 [Mesorhizobium sp. AaZ16]|uniref:hypothetical protein n=1 Tax=Mesorhizobium sp. AaZ16 TaxID=3402289 RepID=UPI00374EE675
MRIVGALHLVLAALIFLAAKSVLHEIYAAVFWLTGWALIGFGHVAETLIQMYRHDVARDEKQDERYRRHGGAASG